MDVQTATRVVERHIMRYAAAKRYQAFRETLADVQNGAREDRGADVSVLRTALYRDSTFGRLVSPHEHEIAFHDSGCILEAVQAALQLPRDAMVIERFVGRGKSGRVFEVSTCEGRREVLKLVCLRARGNSIKKGHEAAIDCSVYEAYHIRNFRMEVFLQQKARGAFGSALVPEVRAGSAEVVRLLDGRRTVWTYGLVAMQKVDGVGGALAALLDGRYREMRRTVAAFATTGGVAADRKKRLARLKYIRFVLHVAESLKELLESMAAANAVHGDFHPGNIACVMDGGDSPRLCLMDFERSVFDPEGKGALLGGGDHRQILELGLDACVMWRWSVANDNPVATDLNAALHVVGFPASSMLAKHLPPDATEEGRLFPVDDTERLVSQVDKLLKKALLLVERCHASLAPRAVEEDAKGGVRELRWNVHLANMTRVLGEHVPFPPLLCKTLAEACSLEDLVEDVLTTAASHNENVVDGTLAFGTIFPFATGANVCFVLPRVEKDGTIAHTEVPVQRTLLTVSNLQRGQHMESYTVSAYTRILMANLPGDMVGLWPPECRTQPDFCAHVSALRASKCGMRLHAFPVQCEEDSSWSLLLLDSMTGVWYVYSPSCSQPMLAQTRCLAEKLLDKLRRANALAKFVDWDKEDTRMLIASPSQMPADKNPRDSGYWVCTFLTIVCRGIHLRIPRRVSRNAEFCREYIERCRRVIVRVFMEHAYSAPCPVAPLSWAFSVAAAHVPADFSGSETQPQGTMDGSVAMMLV